MLKSCTVASYADTSDRPCADTIAEKRQIGAHGLEALHLEDGECHPSPLVIDIDRQGFDFGGPENIVGFNLFTADEPVHIQWLKPGGGDAFLALDLDGNGLVDNGLELFGNGTILIEEGNKRAPNGFVALGQYDRLVFGGNEDGLITQADIIWADLRLWVDENADGICTHNEMMELETYGLTSLATIPKENNRHDPYGNWLPFWSWTLDNQHPVPNKLKMVDVFFKEHHDQH